MIDNLKKLEKLVEVFDKEINLYKQNHNIMNEQNTRQQYIDVLLNLLGWDITNSQGHPYNEREIVAEEYSGKKDRPDYTVKYNGVSKFYIEAKKVSVPIEKELESALQIRRYGWNSKHRIGVLTNFENLIIYQTYVMPNENDKVSSYRYKIYHYSEYVSKFPEIYSLISRQSVVEGQFDKWTNEISPENATKHALDNIFLKSLNNWRLKIANNLLRTDKSEFKNPRYLNEIVQTFLNQIIFLRFAEDNALEENKNIYHLMELYPNYYEYIKALDKKYNSGIFKNAIVMENIDKNILEEIVNALYFPNVSYDFSVIELTLLSKIYENFLQEEIVIVDGIAILEKTNYTKVKSVVSTPQEIVIFMVKKALDPLFIDITPEEILRLRIADLAVGSGVFLIEAYNYIENYLIDYYSSVNEESPSPFSVPFEMKRDIIENVLFGYDINNQAVELTRFSLLLRIIENESAERIRNIKPILPSLSNNIVCGNTLVEQNNLDILEVNLKDLYVISPMMENKLPVNYFDVIIGNPPYLNKEDIKSTTPKKEIEVYNTEYSTSIKQYDKYFLFIEKSLKIIKNTGRVVLLIPNKFFVIGSGEKLRNYILDKKGLNEIIDFGYNQVFEDVINYVAIIDFSNFNNNFFNYQSIAKISDISNSNNKLKYDMNELDSNHWFLTANKSKLELYKTSMNKFPNILEEIHVFNGIQTSRNPVYYIPFKDIIEESEEYITFEKTKNKVAIKFTIEKGLLRGLYAPRNKVEEKAYKFIEPNTYVIFPYEEGKIIDEDSMMNRFPMTLDYLSRFKEDLLPKALGGKRDVRNSSGNILWYEYGRSQYLKGNKNDKILVGVLSKEPSFNIDRNNLLFASGGTAGIIGVETKEKSQYSLEYILAWLNHPFTDDIFKTLGSDFEGGFYTHGTGIYKNIPLLPINFNDSSEKLIHNKITHKVKEIEKINIERKKPENIHLRDTFNLQRVSLINSINDIIDELLLIKKDELNEINRCSK
ncbi:Eco57I restriction-modification methylase domain-containing protein [Staphylococcus coagulans]|uniref:Eco57I restriction-modification methylase domain-containing protein n=1 Tax=Staphylococcus coagulans TaxID=74706 RepID=UPI0030EE9B73